jgi:transcriptional regulator with XRE-family HTH domain
MALASLDSGPASVGDLLRWWRAQRRLSQLDLAVQAGVSSRHLSFVETGRSKPSRELVLHLAEELDVPLRERNALLLAAGFAPSFREHGLSSPELAGVREAIDVILRGHEPNPALVVDRHWNMVEANAGMAAFVALLPPELLDAPVNVIRASLHPDGLGRRIVNFDEYATHLISRIRRQVNASGDGGLRQLLDEVTGYEGVAAALARTGGVPTGVVLPMRVRLDGGMELSFFSTMTVFGAPLDVTVEELAIESFFPADEATAAAVRELASAPAAAT